MTASAVLDGVTLGLLPGFVLVGELPGFMLVGELAGFVLLGVGDLELAPESALPASLGTAGIASALICTSPRRWFSLGITCSDPSGFTR